jgi:hypothetical protein
MGKNRMRQWMNDRNKNQTGMSPVRVIDNKHAIWGFREQEIRKDPEG